jgi:hypothetical protein
MTDALAIAPHPLATEATDGVGASVDIGTQRSCLKLDLLVDSMTATKLTVSVEHSPSTSGPWALLGPLFPVTAPVVRSALMIKSKRFVRVTWALTGGGNASFQVTGEAHTLYATPTDVNTFAFPEKGERVAAEPRTHRGMLGVHRRGGVIHDIVQFTQDRLG